LGRVGCLGQRGPCKPAPFRRRLLLIDSRAFRFLSGILAPLGNSTNRRTNSPQISTTYFVPTGKRRGSWNALLTSLPPVPRSTRANLRASVWPEFVRIAVIHAIKCGKIQPRLTQLRASFHTAQIGAANPRRISMDEKQKPRALARGFRKT